MTAVTAAARIMRLTILKRAGDMKGDKWGKVAAEVAQPHPSKQQTAPNRVFSGRNRSFGPILKKAELCVVVVNALQLVLTSM